MSEQRKKYDLLPPKLMSKAPQLITPTSNSKGVCILPEDVEVEFLDQYKKISEDGIINLADCEILGGQFLYAKDVCVNNSKVCLAFQLEAERLLAKEEALAKLERAIKKYGTLDEKSGVTKITDGKAEAYVDLDEKVLEYRLLANSWKILAEFFVNHSYLFDKKHDWVKKLMGGERDTASLGERRA